MEGVQARGKKDKEERDHNVLGKIGSPAPSFIGMIPTRCDISARDRVWTRKLARNFFCFRSTVIKLCSFVYIIHLKDCFSKDFDCC